jgi:hypothetical protein
VTPLDLLLPGEPRIDDYYDNVTASTKLGFDVTDHFDLGLVARYTDTHLRLTGENVDNFRWISRIRRRAKTTPGSTTRARPGI